MSIELPNESITQAKEFIFEECKLDRLILIYTFLNSSRYYEYFCTVGDYIESERCT